MKKSKFYYSRPAYEVKVIATTNDEGEIVCYPIKNQKVRERSRITICGVLDTDTNTLSFGAAVCSNKDRFVKSIGRQLSETRALNAPIVKVMCNKNNISDVFRANAFYIEGQISYMKHLELNGKL